MLGLKPNILPLKWNEIIHTYLPKLGYLSRCVPLIAKYPMVTGVNINLYWLSCLGKLLVPNHLPLRSNHKPWTWTVLLTGKDIMCKASILYQSCFSPLPCNMHCRGGRHGNINSWPTIAYNAPLKWNERKLCLLVKKMSLPYWSFNHWSKPLCVIYKCFQPIIKRVNTMLCWLSDPRLMW